MCGSSLTVVCNDSRITCLYCAVQVVQRQERFYGRKEVRQFIGLFIKRTKCSLDQIIYFQVNEIVGYCAQSQCPADWWQPRFKTDSPELLTTAKPEADALRRKYTLIHFPFLPACHTLKVCSPSHQLLSMTILCNWGFPGGTSGEEPTRQCRRRHRREFYLWVRKSPWRRAWQRTPASLPWKSHRQRSLVGYRPSSRKESDTMELA